ncbi:QLQ [Musa troglodytarum]|uniref:Growth-regulating factor n=1 Tax=Musa troglodytarum TaxID=320322 RepID=A0A9E7EN21_9LILI|nr:QLQ [Musa troglodytarum]
METPFASPKIRLASEFTAFIRLGFFFKISRANPRFFLTLAKLQDGEPTNLMIVDVGEEKQAKLAGSETLTRSSSSDRVNSPPPEHEEEEESQQTQPLRQQGLPPHKVARVSSDEVTMAAPSSLMLGLGLGLGRGPGAAKPVFTFMQLQELEHQALIYKYMAAGLPVPVHLVLPIWKSVAASSFGPYVYPSCSTPPS